MLFLNVVCLTVALAFSIPVTREEYQALLYAPAEEDWFPNGQDAECYRLVSGIEQLLEIKKLALNFGSVSRIPRVKAISIALGTLHVTLY
jgi:hypothetical protein